jgi:hypothetical protein
VAASARESREIRHRRDGHADVTGHAAAAIAARLRAARYYARVPELPFTTRSLTRTEHLARSRRIALWATIGYAGLIAVVALALVNEEESTWTVGLVVVVGLALGAGPLMLLTKAQASRSEAYRDPLLTLTIAADRFTTHAGAVALIDAPWRELRLVELTYDKAGMRYGFIVELAGVIVEHRGKTVTIDPAWVVHGRAAATAIVTRLIAARRLSA